MIPADYPQRAELNDEVHARPPDRLLPPQRISSLALLSDVHERENERAHVAQLAALRGAPAPAAGSSHYSADFGDFRLKWERHTEFSRYVFIADGVGPGDDPFVETALARVPGDWLGGLRGRVIFAAHVAYLPGTDEAPNPEQLSAEMFSGNALIGSLIGGGAAAAFTDFRIHADNFSRVLVIGRSLRPLQAGRMIQRILEIDTYRLMALLALPTARELVPFLTRAENDLAQITSRLLGTADEDEEALLGRLTRLAAEIETREAASHYRFGAAAAYYDLVRRRIDELREERIEGLQTFREFTERRLAPAMNTCRGVAARERALSERVSRATQLLSTRVDVEREQQNRALLASMDRRAKLQLRLQMTVERLSIAAVTYYVVALVGLAARGIVPFVPGLQPDIVMALSIPVVVLAAALGVRSIRRMVDPGRF
jgi:uncharacterized membrane-anchored protein